ncbi:MAG TPA: murein transglycosylase A [Alphaproteobacteria bacterium]|nr:murein transglycosylase A [Alphaproteobacteria bacterium]
MAKQKYLSALALVLFLTACASEPKVEKPTLTKTDFTKLPGWDSDNLVDAIPALVKSCAVITKKAPDAKLGVAGTKADWSAACADLAMLPPRNNDAARDFLTHWFQPYAVTGKDGGEGLFTGYYEPQLRGSFKKTASFQTPLYPRPDDLIGVDLGEFKSDLHGQRIVGKVEGSNLKPYDTRAEISNGSLDKRAKPLLWVDDPVDAFFLEVQGSGDVKMTDGSVTHVGYDGANGRAYVAIGRAMADQSLIEKPVTMQSIRAWLNNNPDRAQEIMDINGSYVFFRKLEDGTGPVGAEGVSLTPQRSLAVDPAFIPLGTPLWLDTQDSKGNALQSLMVAQDTGGAIKGAVRGDVFWGAGDEAAAQAGAMQSKGHYYVLLPQGVSVDGDE